MSKFDAYWATFRGESALYRGELVPRLFDSVLVDMCRELDATPEIPKSKLPGGYQEAYALVRGGEVVCHMLTGGTGSAEGTHGIRVQGAASPEVAKLIRELVPSHAPSRIDVAEDFCGEGFFDWIVPRVEEIAIRRRVSLRREGEGWYEHQRDKGRTLYIGSRDSVVFGRIYERGKKLLGEGQQADPNYVRIELQVQPKSKSKSLLGMVEPDGFWGASAWTKELATLMGADQVQRIKCGTVWSKPDIQRSIQALARQYGQTLLDLVNMAGSAEAALQVVRDAMTGDREVREALKRVRTAQLVESVDTWS